MAETRKGVLTGQDISLKVLVTDDTGTPRDTDALPSLYIYDTTVDSELMLDEIEAETFTSALVGPLTATKIGTGYYEYVYTVPSASEEGYWYDVWTGDLDTATITSIQSFRVVAGGSFDAQSLSNNQMVVITLDSSITNSDGDKTLEDDVVLSFSTVYSPYYASVSLVRSKAGPLVGYLPDDSIALMIHWASREVDAIRPRKICSDKFPFWRAEFIMLDVALKSVSLPGGAYSHGLNGSGGGSKSLGEFSVKDGTYGQGSTMSGGVDAKTFDELKKLRDEVWRVVNAGGCINPGQSLGFNGAMRGLYDPARRKAGRLWLSPEEHYYGQPTANTKLRKAGERMWRFGYKNRGTGRGMTRSGGWYYD